MSPEVITFFSFFLGVSSVVLGLLAVYLAKRTDELIKSEDERAKMLIDEGNKRTQLMLEHTQQMIDEGRKETRELLNAIWRGIEEGRKALEESRREFRELIERMDKRISERTTYMVREK